MPTIYRVIARDDNKVQQFRDAYRASVFMLGRRISAYIVVKSDERGDRAYQWPTNTDIMVIEKELEAL